MFRVLIIRMPKGTTKKNCKTELGIYYIYIRHKKYVICKL